MTEAKKKRSKARFIEELVKYPVVSVACQRANLNRATLYRWKQDDDDFNNAVDYALEEGVGLINDLAESKLIAGIKDGSHQSVRYWLEHNHQKYSRYVKPNTYKFKDPVAEVLKRFGLLE